MECSFKFDHFEYTFQEALRKDYQIITVKDYFLKKYDENRKILINRIDVDVDCFRARRFAEIFNKLGIKGSFYFRLHGSYNLFSFEIFNIVKEMVSNGHEVGIHTEIIDMHNICNEDPEALLKKEIRLFEDFFKTKISGVASHGDYTGFNNLDFWSKQGHRAEDFGLIYEAYDEKLWNHTRYVSDSLITSWKSYENGVLKEGDNRCACQHIQEETEAIYLLTHPFCFYDRHFHEMSK